MGGKSKPKVPANATIVTEPSKNLSELDAQELANSSLPETRILVGSAERDYVPPLRGDGGGALQYELYPGVMGQAIRMEKGINAGKVWITYCEPIPEAWGKGQMDAFLDKLHPDCRIVNAGYGELYLFLHNKGWINRPQPVSRHGQQEEVDVWYPPRPEDDKPHDGQGGFPEGISL